ncbi:MAG: 50S ribosomal protein L28 [Candidatus Magasanikbacteria bacterium GW2011_GWD2_43_18]|nr:MAG: 50S ribosomal protein L28 [Candidatus Magasanikbacteria bacterium GW2011_GWC2_42_27]KKT05105.1 MAG: 50S ribosomal protein L28 [Candidatus Magasanikbacteria bacterium GW2011_GWD2_43_18]KKT24338.1 MAG: 50S ribosomal protein L28 [Candidatus Magasanikbacteria bacterium GW2011_GWA2_43_9]HBB38089.1 50S ribosomal protein L28 [Candidatus Magasanikbacteria bacterium]HCC14077.1 50S ribosomal protein L28 [Candidatus Magasanikbacteria bacterium]
MARICDLCGKGSKKAASRSHSKIKTLRRQHPNLQKMDGKMVCTRCMRTAAKHASKATAAAAVVAA